MQRLDMNPSTESFEPTATKPCISATEPWYRILQKMMETLLGWMLRRCVKSYMHYELGNQDIMVPEGVP